MPDKKKKLSNAADQVGQRVEKPKLHPRNKHRQRYDFKQLSQSTPHLAPFVRLNDYGDESIDFFNPEAVKALNKALLKHYYSIKDWDIPKGYLCPPIPGRADYIHHMADLLTSSHPPSKQEKPPTGSEIKCLDIGVGANCVYPIIGHAEYGWSFVGADIDPVAITSASKIIEANPQLKGKVELRLQSNAKNIFVGIIQKDEHFDLTICNPPFHASFAEAQSGTMRKLRNLKQKKITKPILNFGGQNTELWYDGGEESFVRQMILQSKQFGTSCFWFSTLISKQANLKSTYQALKEVSALDTKTIPMGQGNKTSRIVSWTFLTPESRRKWAKMG
ncbi:MULTISPECIES: 23S rRNA (adenine(1618)-N(6))-methyltransferase RlmF [unclassified Imperialibacter]|uniref:23S rRNA (adenine(1618)-N(6))-methyltransferase RlmF n=1 Tax=unclassified Imperialibacter TaxID=2629706 RepID=UPI00125B4457|nr:MULTISPECIES: 23S rRNA (adenine(1618)-N(6))-methyltransferase RlmF [unclassified Imperialibacter]CAD5250798.1 putative AdoMet-dependent methyltransferase [Imperialibacter sp. 75]CAD5285695.1 putative AdoMet-dependent methyltransferase [Imperialibacter sp. 89]VVT04906.1 putative AdoMet-dependent methyltransferase [Imperialibacter sp. EC-SDR9]